MIRLRWLPGRRPTLYRYHIEGDYVVGHVNSPKHHNLRLVRNRRPWLILVLLAVIVGATWSQYAAVRRPAPKPKHKHKGLVHLDEGWYRITSDHRGEVTESTIERVE